MVFGCLAVSAIFLAAVNAVACFRQRGGLRLATLWSVVAVLPFFCTTMLVLPLNALLVAGTGAACWAVNARPRWFVASSLIVTLAGYVLIAVPDLRAWGRLKRKFPLESLAGRLAYEDRPRPATASSPLLNLDRVRFLEGRLEEARIPGDWPDLERVRSLEHLHAGVVKQFIDSPGFGAARKIGRPSTYILERERRAEATPNGTMPQPPIYSPLDPVPAGSKPVRETDLLSSHDEAVLAFVNRPGFGYVRSRDQVAGFRPHGFRSGVGSPARWQVDRVELVGLLKYDGPVVYLSSNLPRMDELVKVPTRPLDAFEKTALEGLLRGEDLMVQEAERRMRLLGAVRAVRQCLGCHRVRRGEMLGAFSYQLSPEEGPQGGARERP
jgi:hypothetical protein